MCRTEIRLAPVSFLYFLAVMCVTAPFVLAHEAEIHGWDSQGKAADAIGSLFSGSEMVKLQALLKNIPPAELQKVASQVVSDINENHTELEKRRSILKAIKEKGLLDTWKEDLENLIFDDNALPADGSDEKAKQFQDNLKCNEKHGKGPSTPHVHLPEGPLERNSESSVHRSSGNPESNGTPYVIQEQIAKNDVDYLFQVAEEELDQPAMKLQPPKQVPTAYKTASKPAASSSQEKRKESNKKPYKKVNQEDPLDVLVGMGKKLLGQEDSNPTLNIVANMASAYIKNMDNSGKKKSGNNGPDLSSLLQLASLFGGGNAGQDNPLQSVASLLGNSGMDMNQLLQMGSALMGQGLEAPASRRSKSSNPIAEMLIRLVANFLNMDSVVLLDYYNGLSKLSEAKSWNEINAILRKTTGLDVETTLDLLINDDVRQQLSDSATSSLAHWLQAFLDPDSIQNKILYLNAFAFQYKYPLVDPKNLVESFSMLVERLSEDYLNTKLNLRPYLKQTEKQLKGLLHIEGPERLDFHKLTENELSMVIQNTMKSKIFDPLADLWTDFRYASRFPKCARTIMCLRNVPSNSAQSVEELKQGFTRAMSTVVVWALSKTNNRGMPTFDALYQAAFSGTTDCKAKYRENCDQILNGPLPSMRLDYEHHEL